MSTVYITIHIHARTCMYVHVYSSVYYLILEKCLRLLALRRISSQTFTDRVCYALLQLWMSHLKLRDQQQQPIHAVYSRKDIFGFASQLMYMHSWCRVTMMCMCMCVCVCVCAWLVDIDGMRFNNYHQTVFPGWGL